MFDCKGDILFLVQCIDTNVIKFKIETDQGIERCFYQIDLQEGNLWRI